ncbi:hypothetical protein IW261DRAFT_1563759 [Armillaria novae-zelandiae]|uniref:DUF7330 domain-containing protein n=1 Tax=Armillaria novae-zelandiae TaxID=153914 RepID=A0AA39UFB3_9AGAR|nr:hypothetical protein IW261DRAFT_1563759 [Armillaria novae-zelandiae]
MIVPKGKNSDPQPAPAEHEEPPPEYEESSTPITAMAPANTKASNYVNIQQYMNSLEESFFIDPTLRLPQALLPALKAGETEDTRRNLSIATTMGSVNVDVTIVYNEPSSQPSESKRRVILVVTNTLGSINMRLHASDSPNRHPFYLHVYSRTGSTDLSLPRSFTGLITIANSLGSVDLSKHLSEFATPLGDAVKGGRRYFIGDLSKSFNNNANDWSGDEVLVEASLASVSLKRDDE